MSPKNLNASNKTHKVLLNQLKDKQTSKIYERFENNLTTICKPKISASKSKPYTKVTWKPDYKRFGINELTDDMFNLFKKRTFAYRRSWGILNYWIHR